MEKKKKISPKINTLDEARPIIIDICTKTLKKKPKKIFVYGSFANPNKKITNTSDIDITVIFPKVRKKYYRLLFPTEIDAVKLKWKLEKELGRKVDFVIKYPKKKYSPQEYTQEHRFMENVLLEGAYDIINNQYYWDTNLYYELFYEMKPIYKLLG